MGIDQVSFSFIHNYIYFVDILNRHGSIYTAADIDVIMENPFVNSAGVGLSNCEIVRFMSSKSIQCNTM